MASLMFAWAAVVVILFPSLSYHTEALIGVNWGRQSAQRLLPSQVVDLMLQNGIGNARIYTSQPDILSAFAGTGINLTVTTNYPSLSTLQDANAWVDRNMDYIVGSNIRSVYLKNDFAKVGGAYVFAEGVDKTARQAAIQSLRLLQGALNDRQLGQQVKVNLPHYEFDLKRNITKPSEAEFRDDVKEEMMEYLQFLQENDSPFPIDIIPLMALDLYSFSDLTFGFADNNSNLVIKDINGAVYTNIFEWEYDCFAWALSKLNASNLKIVVSQVGWPTDGFPGASIANAERFFRYLLPLVTSNKGTPMRPGAPIDTYVHALTDENKMSIEPLARHWGIYRSNGDPKYKIDLSGQGRDMYLTTVKGIMRMPSRWCLFNGDTSDSKKVNYWFDWTCKNTDCSGLNTGGSCSNLSLVQNVSYAFNMYFQFKFQEESDCDFGGLGYMAVEDPSTESCVFPIEVVKGRQVNYAPASSEGFRTLPWRPHLGLLAFWVWVFSMKALHCGRSDQHCSIPWPPV